MTAAARPVPVRLSETARAEILRLAGLYERRQSALLPALFVAQRERGYLSPEVLDGVAEVLDLPVSEVVSVASFYTLLYLDPVGRHVIQVCTNLACLVNGCHAVVQRLHERLGVKPGATTADGRFTLRTVECLAACDEAPSVIVDEDRWARVSPDDVDKILERYP